MIYSQVQRQEYNSDDGDADAQHQRIHGEDWKEKEGNGHSSLQLQWGSLRRGVAWASLMRNTDSAANSTHYQRGKRIPSLIQLSYTTFHCVVIYFTYTYLAHIRTLSEAENYKNLYRWNDPFTVWKVSMLSFPLSSIMVLKFF